MSRKQAHEASLLVGSILRPAFWLWPKTTRPIMPYQNNLLHMAAMARWSGIIWLWFGANLIAAWELSAPELADHRPTARKWRFQIRPKPKKRLRITK